jgi:GDP-L-fucose synthase
MKILVTGGSGLVGSAIKKISKNYKQHTFIFVNSKEYDLTQFSQTRLMLIRIFPDCVIHLAANVGGLYKNMENKVEILEDNLAINFNIVKCCGEFKIKKLLACLSTCIFPDKVSYPIDELMLHQGEPHMSNEGYAYAKRMLEIHIRKYREQYGYDYMCITPCNIYGPNDNFNLEDSHVIPGLIHQCYLAKKNNKNFIVKGDGTPLRQFIFNEDLAILIMEIIKLKNCKYPNIILSPDTEVSIKEIAENIKEAFHFKKNITFDTSFSNGQHKKTVSNKILRKIVPDFCFTDLSYGIRDTVSWFIENYENCRK